ncbi:MAG TPA: amidohydrolase, partial [Chromatiales bacterium]|nr:amidohydrolase [Chromatiales bacterium]
MDERFERQGNNASWRSAGEQGRETLQQPAFYIPLNGAPEVTGVLARALLQADNHELPLLPSGSARITKASTAELDIGDEQVTATLYFIDGLGFSPQPIWLDETGQTFAIVSSWFALIPKHAEQESVYPELLDAQQEMLDQHSQQLAADLSRLPAGPWLIRNARLFDPRDQQVRPGMSVLIDGERISAVAPDDEIDSELAVEVIDAGGRLLMPGLWDSHQHFSGTTGLMDLASGVTSSRDLANQSEPMMARKQRFDDGSELGPRVILGGFMDGPGELAGPTKVLVDTVEEATRWVDWYADNGYRQIKVYSSLKPELVAPIARAAHSRGLRLSGHVPAFMSAEQFVRDGADEIQHINMLFLNFLTDIAPDTRDTTRFTAVAEHAHRIDPAQPEVRAFIELLRERHVAVDPTVTIFESLFSGDPHA